MSYELIEIERFGAVGRISLNRESARNAQSVQLLDEVNAAFDELEGDEGIRVILLAAKGKHFSAGHDLREGAARRGGLSVEERWVFEEQKYFNYCLRIWDCPKPTVVQVQGACIAAGFMLANMCDLMVVSESAYFSDPVVHTLSAAAVEVLVHPWVMGLRKSKEMLMTGCKISAAEALQMGMANKMVPDEQLDEAAMEMAQQVAKASPFAMRLIKRSLNRSLDAQGFRIALNAHFDTHELSHRTNEYKESVRKYTEKPAAASRS
jgi:enoyl-CoA hydratase